MAGRAAAALLNLGHIISTHKEFFLLLRLRQELVVLITGLSEGETKSSQRCLSVFTHAVPLALSF